MLRKSLSATLAAALLAGSASADTLRQALVSSYQTNPTLTAQRQTLEATDATVAIESDPALAAAGKALGIDILVAPLEAGFAEAGPYDQILIDSAVEYIPETIIAQLADGGRLGTALVDAGVTRLVVGRKVGDAFGILSFGDAGVPALPGFSRPKAFKF